MRQDIAASLGMAIAMLVSAPASAADIGLAAPAGAVVTARSWTGCYGGAFGGYQWGRSRQDYGGLVNGVPNAFLPTGFTMAGPYSVDGGQIGLTLGCNYQTGSFVFGVEADTALVLANGRSRPTAAASGLGLNDDFEFTTEQRYASTLRARLGYAVNNWLFYATGGLAHGGFDVNNQNSIPALLMARQNPAYVGKFGWVVGLGVEYSLSPNASVKTEALYVDYGRLHYGDAPGAVTGCTAGCVNADVSMRAIVVRVGFNYNFMTGPSAVVARY
jgi:outer membrane immunogenic protein